MLTQPFGRFFGPFDGGMGFLERQMNKPLKNRSDEQRYTLEHRTREFNFNDAQGDILMGLFVKSASVAALAGALTMTMAMAAQAATVTKPKVTGIGFANSEAGAVGRAVRAWTNTTRSKYGKSFANYNKAKGKSLSCDYIGGVGAFAKRKKSIGIEGNPNSKWTCTAKARPVGKVFGGGPSTKKMTGIGFAHKKWKARGKAIKAWRKAARNRYGKSFDKFFLAKNKSVNCARIGFAKTFAAKGSGSVVVIGNPNAPWTCTAKGRPRSLVGLLN